MTFDHKWVVPARSPRSTPKTGMTQTVPNLVGYWGLTTTTAADQLKLLVSRHRNEFHIGVRSNGYQSNSARGAGALTNVQRFKVTGH